LDEEDGVAVFILVHIDFLEAAFGLAVFVTTTARRSTSAIITLVDAEVIFVGTFAMATSALAFFAVAFLVMISLVMAICSLAWPTWLNMALFAMFIFTGFVLAVTTFTRNTLLWVTRVAMIVGAVLILARVFFAMVDHIVVLSAMVVFSVVVRIMAICTLAIWPVVACAVFLCIMAIGTRNVFCLVACAVSIVVSVVTNVLRASSLIWLLDDDGALAHVTVRSRVDS
jgi:hypothetical protein